ncbi:helix-turn-helix transcriptional regulator [Geomesophilobacter sediminis]|uniref:Response regulator transcription factor n=1 Tax=Geomesophilobacter sediminis TaxID=2798584 RepID=A0A8J7SBA9_9BACT|nr:response regulator transcription factor [Geomesophilobacter sediminis]MBJ6727975.1 response regulator transcription factor [Geomesophilobacter sediminis]
MNILLSMKSRLIETALQALLSRGNQIDSFLVDDATYERRPTPVDVIVADKERICLKGLSSWSGSKVILLDMGLAQDELLQVLTSYRLCGVISTDEDPVLMKKALRLVYDGEVWIGNRYVQALLRGRETVERGTNEKNVSRREGEILQHLAQGKKNKEIAYELHLSEQTVKVHLSHIFKKFKVTSRLELIKMVHDFPLETTPPRRQRLPLRPTL